MEVCAGFELIAIENTTALGHDVLEISKRREVLVGEWLVEDGAEGLSRLKLGGGWGEEGQAGTLRPDPGRGGGASRRAGSHPARPGSVRCASRRCRARAR